MTNELEKAKFYLKEAHSFFDLVNETRRRIDEKIFNMIVVAGVLINLVAGLAYVFIEQKIILEQYTFLFLTCSVVLYLIVTVFGLIAYRPTGIVARDIRRVIEKYEKGEEESEPIPPMQHLAWNLSRDAEENQKSVLRKAVWFRRMLIAFAIGLGFLIIAFVSIIPIPTC